MGGDLFGVGKRPAKAKAAPTPPGAIQRLIGVWASLFEARYREKPIITARDAAALKRLIGHADVATVERRLRAYLDLDDPYISGQGYPLALMLGAWNRLIATDRQPLRVQMDADRTTQYLDDLKRRGQR